jgi:hypothetical protein
MSAYSEKVAKAKHGFYRVADFETVREVTHTIAYLLEDQVVFDGEKKDILCFEDTGRQLILNVTNAGMLITLFGDEPNGWAGRRVTLYRGSYGKDNKPCVRVKAASGAPAQAQMPFTDPPRSGANGAAKETTQATASPPPGSPDIDDSIPF